MTTTSGKTEPHRRTSYSAGGVLYRVENGQLYIALIATDRGKRWGLPKGHVQRGETPEMAAVREIAEETGLRGTVLEYLTTIEYWFRSGSTRIHKYVDLFLLRYVSGDVVPQFSEVDDARWIALPEALDMLSFRRERDVVAQVYDLWRQGQLAPPNDPAL